MAEVQAVPAIPPAELDMAAIEDNRPPKPSPRLTTATPPKTPTKTPTKESAVKNIDLSPDKKTPPVTPSKSPDSAKRLVIYQNGDFAYGDMNRFNDRQGNVEYMSIRGKSTTDDRCQRHWCIQGRPQRVWPCGDRQRALHGRLRPRKAHWLWQILVFVQLL